MIIYEFGNMLFIVFYVPLYLKKFLKFNLRCSFTKILQDNVLKSGVSIPAEEATLHLRLVRLIDSPEDGSPTITHTQ
jgi:hypothetical protein